MGPLALALVLPAAGTSAAPVPAASRDPRGCAAEQAPGPVAGWTRGVGTWRGLPRRWRCLGAQGQGLRRARGLPNHPFLNVF